MTRRRLDAELVRRGLARSREQSRELIETGRVRAPGMLTLKPSTQVDEALSLHVEEMADSHYVSRGAHKLLGALDANPDLAVAGRDCLDAGASTGGFTQVLLERGAARVLAVDVGYGQLAWSVRTDPRVTVMERTNVRDLQPAVLPFRPTLIVADLSFISLGTVLPALVASGTPDAELLLMVKPQFEVGRDLVGAGGVVRDPGSRLLAMEQVAGSAHRLGLGVVSCVASPLPGPSGNVEYFLRLQAGAPAGRTGDFAEAIARGPQ